MWNLLSTALENFLVSKKLSFLVKLGLISKGHLVNKVFVDLNSV